METLTYKHCPLVAVRLAGLLNFLKLINHNILHGITRIVEELLHNHSHTKMSPKDMKVYFYYFRTLRVCVCVFLLDNFMYCMRQKGSRWHT